MFELFSVDLYIRLAVAFSVLCIVGLTFISATCYMGDSSEPLPRLFNGTYVMV
jgi:hypothetical protein